MRPLTLTIIHEEHAALAAMLRSLSMLLQQSRRNGTPPDFEVLRAMLFYIDEFPERLHHTKETTLLFPKLRAKVPGLNETLNRLDQEHTNGERAIRNLEHLMIGYEVMGESRREAFENAVGRYVEFYLSHMGLEEQTILPAAKAHFSADDWAELDQAFAENRDPLAGHGSLEIYQPVVQKILQRAPAPIGLGPSS